MNGGYKMDLQMLRALNQAQIQTLRERGDSPELFRAQVVEKILADDDGFAQLQTDEIVDVLVALGLTADAAREQAAKLKS